jgi:hypothetical protein
MFGFSQKNSVTTTPHAYPNFLNKNNNPFRMQMPNCFGYLSIFVDVGENLAMVDDVTTPSNSLVAPIKKKSLKKHRLT